MVTGSSKVWVGIDNQPIELKKSNDGSLELNEWECICAADALNVGDYCFGAPLISENLSGLTRYQPERYEMHITDNHILVAHQRNTGYWYSAIIPKQSPVQDYNSYNHLALAENSSITSPSFEYKTGDAFKFSYEFRGSQYTKYYDISSGDYATITQAEYEAKQDGSQFPFLLKLQTVYYTTGSDNDYQNVQCWLSSIAGTQTVLTISGISDFTSSYISYHFLDLTDTSLIIYQQPPNTGVFILDYAYKKDSNTFRIGPKQAMPITYTPSTNNFESIEVDTPKYSVTTNPVIHGVVTAKIDATHVIVAS